MTKYLIISYCNASDLHRKITDDLFCDCYGYMIVDADDEESAGEVASNKIHDWAKRVEFKARNDEIVTETFTLELDEQGKVNQLTPEQVLMGELFLGNRGSYIRMVQTDVTKFCEWYY